MTRTRLEVTPRPAPLMKRKRKKRRRRKRRSKTLEHSTLLCLPNPFSIIDIEIQKGDQILNSSLLFAHYEVEVVDINMLDCILICVATFSKARFGFFV